MLLGQVYKAGALTAEKLKGAEVSWRDVFDEIPISISNRWAVCWCLLLQKVIICTLRVRAALLYKHCGAESLSVGSKSGMHHGVEPACKHFAQLSHAQERLR